MNFASARVFWLGMVLLPLLGLFFWWSWRKRQYLISLFVQNRLLAELTVGVSAARLKVRMFLLWVAVAFLVLTLARPQWGFTWEEATVRGRDIIVAIDTSRSMLAGDIQPNRLARAKLAAMDLLRLARYDRLGLVAFAGTAFLQCPLTLDDEAFRQSVEILTPGIIPQGGSALAEAIATARASFSKSEGDNHKIIVLFTDGEDHEQGALDSARLAALDGIRVFTVGVGTAEGELLRVPDESGNMVFLKDGMGNAVKSRLNEALLQQIAKAANGFYLPLQGGDPMQVLYEKGLKPLPTSEQTTRLMRQFKEQFYWPLCIAMILLIIELFLPDRKRSVVKQPGQAGLTAGLLLMLLCTPAVQASSASAMRSYRAGNYGEALEKYKRLLETRPEDPYLNYNAGTAAYQLEEFDAARKYFDKAARVQDLDLQQLAFYNSGNAAVRQAEHESNLEGKIEYLNEALIGYGGALKLRPDDSDAEFNRGLVEDKLKELKEELKKQQQQQQENNEDPDSQDDQKEQQQQDNSEQQEGSEQQEQQQENSDQQQQQQQQQNPGEETEEQRDQQEQQPPQKPGDEQEESQQQRAGQGEPSDQQQQQDAEAAQEGEFAQLGQMTPAQAKQLLDAQKGEEKALLFVPAEDRSSRNNRSFKDW